MASTSTNVFSCPHCGQSISSPHELIGQNAACPHCGGEFVTPGINLGSAAPRDIKKLCPFCAEPIAFNAIKCKHCGSALPASARGAVGPGASAPTGITAPLLISAILNILVALFWIATVFLFFLAIPCIILCVFEFKLYAKAGRLNGGELAARAKSIGIAEILVGIFCNTASFICGIVLLINASSLRRRTYAPYG